eukprot:GHVL01010803.1.p1 GENE.GHVL01010803.1~~GHVL01010803.1.p1  ORF type:complete len:148 (-),score=7.23 GHVL01010803.1:1173-1616(-)
MSRPKSRISLNESFQDENKNPKHSKLCDRKILSDFIPSSLPRRLFSDIMNHVALNCENNVQCEGSSEWINIEKKDLSHQSRAGRDDGNYLESSNLFDFDKKNLDRSEYAVAYVCHIYQNLKRKEVSTKRIIEIYNILSLITFQPYRK